MNPIIFSYMGVLSSSLGLNLWDKCKVLPQMFKTMPSWSNFRNQSSSTFATSLDLSSMEQYWRLSLQCTHQINMGSQFVERVQYYVVLPPCNNLNMSLTLHVLLRCLLFSKKGRSKHIADIVNTFTFDNYLSHRHQPSFTNYNLRHTL